MSNNVNTKKVISHNLSFFVIMIIGDNMASAIIHLCIAKRVNEILKRDEKEFLLGSIAPDISKQVGESKLHSHFLTSVDRDIPELDRFLIKYKDTLKNNDFNLGYYCHLFADMIWFGIFMPEFCKLKDQEITYITGEKKTLKSEVLIKLLYNDYTNLNIQMIDEYELDLSLFYEEHPHIESEITEIPIDKINLIIEKMGLIIEESKERGTIIFDKDAICRYIDKTVEEFIYNLKEIGVVE